jgi:predicted deacylase
MESSVKRTLTVANLSAAPGTVATGFLNVGELSDGFSPIAIPVILLNGVDEGPTVYLHVGSHGQEPFYAIEAIRRLRSEWLLPNQLRGNIIIVPAANVLAYQAGTRVAPQYAAREQRPFGGDLHRGWPGRPDGFLTERLAHAIWTEIVSQSDYVVDFHSVGQPGIGFTHLYSGGTKDARGTSTWDATVKLAQAAGLTILVAGQSDTLTGACLDAAKPSVMMELPSARLIDENAVDTAVRSVRNLLASLDVIAGPTQALDCVVVPGIHRTLPSLRANHGGVINYTVEPGLHLAAGTVIARIYDLFGTEVEAVRLPSDAYVHTFPPVSWVGAQMVATGDWVADLFE